MQAPFVWTMYPSPFATVKLSAPPLPFPMPSHVTRVVPPALGTILSILAAEQPLALMSENTLSALV